MRISDWSSDVCSSDLATREIGAGGRAAGTPGRLAAAHERQRPAGAQRAVEARRRPAARPAGAARRAGRSRRVHAPGVAANPAIAGHLVGAASRSEEHTSELQSLMRNSYALFFLTKKNKT